MKRLRDVGSEFHYPDDFKSGTLVNQPYLIDMQAYQKYLDGDLSSLYGRHNSDAVTNDITGMRYYTTDDGDILNRAFYEINLFMAAARYVNAAVFEASPIPLDADDETQARWDEVRIHFMREARKAVAWKVAKGRGVLQLQERVGSKILLVAIDPQFWVPLTDPVNRDIVIGDVILQRYFYREPGDPIQPGRTPNRVRIEVSVTEEQAEISDGRVPVTNTKMDFIWAGDDATGVVSSGTIGDSISIVNNTRSRGIWTFGDDDSIFATMERNTFEFILAISNMRTTLTQDVRSIAILPDVADETVLDENGKFKPNKLRPQYQANLDSSTSGAVFGYVDPPGPMMADAYQNLANMALDNLSYTANLPREAFGLNMQANESGEALNKLQQIFKTMVLDIRDDLSRILTQAFNEVTGSDATIGWEHEPFTQTVASDDRALKFYAAGLTSQATAQAMAKLPIEDIQQESEEQDDGQAEQS